MIAVKVMMDWNSLRVGESFGPYKYDITPEIASRYRDALSDNEIQTLDSVAIVPPTLLTFPVLQMVDDKYFQRPGMVHTQQDYTFLAPVAVGEKLTTVGILTHMFLKRERRFLEIETSTRNERGQEVLTARMQLMHPPDSLPDASGRPK